MYPLLNLYIKKSGKNKAEIAKEVKVPTSTFYEKIAGRSKIDLDLALRIKKAVGAKEPIEILFETAPATHPVS